MRVTKLLRGLLGLGHLVVIAGWALDGGERPKLTVTVRLRSRRRARCGRCGQAGPLYDRGDGARRWRHVDVGFATCEIEADAPRVCCPAHGPTVAEVPWARHGSRFSRAFEDLVVYDAIASNKLVASRRHEVSWRAVDGMCERVLAEALGRVDLLDGLVAIAIDEVKYKKGAALSDRGVRSLHRPGDLGGQGPQQRHRRCLLRRLGRRSQPSAGFRVL